METLAVKRKNRPRRATDAFMSGWMLLRQKDAPLVKQEIMAALGIKTYQAFLYKRLGYNSYSPVERQAIENIFAKYGVKKVWGDK